jgi:antitoxin MazE
MLTKVQKWGNSLGLRIPRSFASDVRVRPGSLVDISLVRGGLMVRAARPARPRLVDLLKGINRRNLHAEVNSGAPQGREAW